MSALVTQLETRLVEPPDVRPANQLIPDLDPFSTDSARERGAHRLLCVLNDAPSGSVGPADLAVLMRQVIRSYQRRLRVAREWWEDLGVAATRADLRVVECESDRFVEILADHWDPNWLPGAQEIDRVQLRRHDSPGLGSGLLYAMTRYSSYQSEAQKAAVEACLFAAPGSTTLVTLPTGSGKSLCALLPAWQTSAGGTRRLGTTLVIVPTVSLALDQERSARQYFQNAISDRYVPRARVGSSTDGDRELIRNGIKDGSLPILYTSPEALLHSELYDVCLQAARDGLLQHLVIDEAHLVETWGAGFRTEFQFLAAYRKKLLGASQGQLRTFLLSATIPERCADLLKQLFGSEGAFGIVQANRLRPEPAFWFAEAPYWRVRQDRILDALFHLPRPAILYLTRPKHAFEWVQLLHRSGFSRVGAFTGETPDADREHLLRAWNKNELDVMVATAAFGLGVDKPDVRTVLHACLPENLDRYYQEVGRSGRDGFGSISLVCVTPDDRDLAHGMKAGSLITPEQALERWEAMRRSAAFMSGTAATVNIDAVPANRPNILSTRRNREWNEHVLLLMQRAKILSIEETRMDTDQPPSMHANRNIDSGTPMRITFHAPDNRFIDPAALQKVVGEYRSQELTENLRELTRLEEIVRDYAPGGTAHRCIAEPLSQLYPDTAHACGGCRVCRCTGRQPYAQPLPITITVPLPPPAAEHLSGDLRNSMLGGRALNVVRYEDNSLENLKARRMFLVRLVRAGIQQVVLPQTLCEDDEWMRCFIIDLAADCHVPHVLLSESWLLPTHRYPLYSVPTAIVYPPDNAEANRLYTNLQAGYPALTQNVTPVIHVVPHAMSLPSLGGFFVDKVNGLQEDADRIMAILEEIEEYSPF